jgi:hypothetical protein
VRGSGPGWTTFIQIQAAAEAALGVQRGPLLNVGTGGGLISAVEA